MVGTLTAPNPKVTTTAVAPVVEWRTHWTVQDLTGFPNDGQKREIIDGDLFVQGVPHIQHQRVIGKLYMALNQWSLKHLIGEAIMNPGIVFDFDNSVIPDVIWISHERYNAVIDDASGHLTAAPELVVEVLSYGTEHERRDREIKRKLYEMRGVREYWIADWRAGQIEVYARNNGRLQLTGTYAKDENLTSHLLPDFSCKVEQII